MFIMMYVSVCVVGYTFVFLYSCNMGAEEQTQGLILAVLAASVLTECMPVECLFVFVHVRVYI